MSGDSLTLLSAAGLLKRPVSPLVGIGLLLLLLAHYLAHDPTHLEVFSTLKLLDNHLQIRGLDETGELFEAAGAIPDVVRQVDFGEAQFIQQVVARHRVLGVAVVVQLQELDCEVEGRDSLQTGLELVHLAVQEAQLEHVAGQIEDHVIDLGQFGEPLEEAVRAR